MRKVFTVTTLVFLIVAGLLFALNDKKSDESVSILSIKQDYQRLITENEKLSITLYLSSNKSFLSEKSNIDNLYLQDEVSEMEVGVSEFRNLDYSEEYQNTKYYAYVIDLSFDIVGVKNLVLELADTNLIIEYKNGQEVEIEVGNITLDFTEYDNPTYIDVNRMFALYKQDDYEYISGIVLDISNKTGLNLSITNIDIRNSSTQMDIENAIVLDQIPDYQSDIDDLLGYQYIAIGNIIENGELALSTNNIVFVPFKYENKITRLNRFPIIIDFKFNQSDYRYYIDDFQFNSQTLRLEANGGRIREFIYHYQRSN